MPQKLIGNFINILTRKYFCFTGRAGRAEFWLWILVMFIVNVHCQHSSRIRSQDRINPQFDLDIGNASAQSGGYCATPA